MVSRMHVRPMGLGKLRISVAEYIEGPYVDIEAIPFVPHGKERIVKMGSVPCRFIRIRSDKKLDHADPGKKIEVFGLPYAKIEERIGPRAGEYLFETPYRLLYGEGKQ